MTRHTARKVRGRGGTGQSVALLLAHAVALSAACTAPDTAERTSPADTADGPLVSGTVSASLSDNVPASPSDNAAPTPPAVRLGVDVLLRDSASLLAGMRVGLITNHTGRSWPAPAYDVGPGRPAEERRGEPALSAGRGVATIDRLMAHPAWDLVALFGPEHGIRGDVDRPVDSSVDDRTGLPIHSLYGETRKPTPGMLEGIDALVFDIQDIGTRYYSYVWTMALAMEAAAEHGLRFVVLDRPNPVGGELVQGNVKPGYMPVAYYETAMRHGLTAGELARYVDGEYHLGADLHVVPMEGWTRDMWWEDTGIPWRAPSPNMPSVESATHYPGTCLFEGTNLSVGRGTPEAFRQWGAPWLDAEAMATALRERDFPGVTFEAVTFAPDGPTDGKYDGEVVRGIRQTVTDRAIYDPVPVAIAALIEIVRLHPDRLRWREGWFDGLAGGPRVREMVQTGATLAEITAPWPAQRAAFETAREPYLLYD